MLIRTIKNKQIDGAFDMFGVYQLLDDNYPPSWKTSNQGFY